MMTEDWKAMPLDELAQLEKDAARYRWLREHRDVLLVTGFFGNGCVNRTIGEVDAEIDAALMMPNGTELTGGATTAPETEK